MNEDSMKVRLEGALENHFAALVDGTDDAVITKTLDGRIMSWNPSAERLFGYTADEAIGQSITLIIPPELLEEEINIIRRLKRGERIDHFRTVRRRKDGSLIDLSLTISPVKDADGAIVAASKIARDITIQKQFEEQQRILLAEMRHRVGNSFAVASGLISVCAREVDSARDLAAVMKDRLVALSSAQSLAVTDPLRPMRSGIPLSELLAEILKPFIRDEIVLEGEDVILPDSALTPLAFVIYELCTNSVKYGALGQEDGRLSIRGHCSGEAYNLTWKETGSFKESSCESSEGFGTQMCDRMLASLGGSLDRKVAPELMTVRITIGIGSE